MQDSTVLAARAALGAQSIELLRMPSSVLCAALLVIGTASCERPEANAAPLPLDPIQGTENALEKSAPEVPPPVARSYATRVVVDLEAREHVKELADGVEYLFWTFEHGTPGPFLRVREGDLVEVRLHNHPDNGTAHNVSFQAANGPSGGGDASLVPPGSSATFSWRALRPGLFLYTSTAAPIGVHVANGMYGQILVEPREPPSPVDHEYQIVQGEFYTVGRFGEPGPQRFSIEKAQRAEPEYVVFNGRVGALTGKHALKAAAGERVRIYFSNAGPNLPSALHVQGEIFDRVNAEGGLLANQLNVQTTLVPPGGSAIVEFTVEVPGDYPILDHSMFRASARGTVGLLSVEGRDDPLIFSGPLRRDRYDPGTRLAKSAAFADTSQDPGALVYARVCETCHQPDGAGVEGVFPPLADSDFLRADRERAIRIVMTGLKGRISVNGRVYSSEMPNPNLDDQQIADVLTYVGRRFNGSDMAVTADDVAGVRKRTVGTSPVLAEPTWALPAN